MVFKKKTYFNLLLRPKRQQKFLESPQPCPPYWKKESTWKLGVTTYNKNCDKKSNAIFSTCGRN